MRRFEDECVCCDLPCIDCGRKHVEHIYCDCCETSLEDSFDYGSVEYDGQELCFDCFTSILIDNFLKSLEKKREFYRELCSNDLEFLEWVETAADDDLLDCIMTEDFKDIARICGVKWKPIEQKRKTTNVYLICGINYSADRIGFSYSSREVLEAYSTRELAEQAIEKWKETYQYDCYYISEIEVKNKVKNNF